MSKRIRARCPCCGMLVTQNRLNEDYDFEFIIQEIGSRGRGGIYQIYREPGKAEGKGISYFKLILAEKLRRIADRLVEQAKDDFLPFAESKKARAAEYEELVSSVELLSAVEFDEQAITELEAEIKPRDEEEWRCLVDVRPQTVLELTPKTFLEG